LPGGQAAHARQGGTVISYSRLRNQDGFVRGVLWIALAIAIFALVLMDSMGVYKAYRASDDAERAAKEARIEYVRTSDWDQAQAAAVAYLNKSGHELKEYKVEETAEGGYRFCVTCEATARTYALQHLGKIPPLKDWVERVTHPVRTGTDE